MLPYWLTISYIHICISAYISEICLKFPTSSLVRFDALDKRIVKDMELAEFYEANSNNSLEGGDGGGLKTMRVTFFMGEKKFGPAEEQTKGNREIEKITGEKFIHLAGVIWKLCKII